MERRPRRYVICLPRKQSPERLAGQSFSGMWHLRPIFMEPYPSCVWTPKPRSLWIFRFPILI